MFSGETFSAAGRNAPGSISSFGLSSLGKNSKSQVEILGAFLVPAVLGSAFAASARFRTPKGKCVPRV